MRQNKQIKDCQSSAVRSWGSYSSHVANKEKGGSSDSDVQTVSCKKRKETFKYHMTLREGV